MKSRYRDALKDELSVFILSEPRLQVAQDGSGIW